MTLRFSGKMADSENFDKLIEAFDGDKRVVVLASMEAIEDYGLTSVQKKASEKYLANKFDSSGRIIVLTSDF